MHRRFSGSFNRPRIIFSTLLSSLDLPISEDPLTTSLIIHWTLEIQKLSEKSLINSYWTPFISSFQLHWIKSEKMRLIINKSTFFQRRKEKGKSFGYSAKIMAKREERDFSLSPSPYHEMRESSPSDKDRLTVWRILRHGKPFSVAKQWKWRRKSIIGIGQLRYPCL